LEFAAVDLISSLVPGVEEPSMVSTPMSKGVADPIMPVGCGPKKATCVDHIDVGNCALGLVVRRIGTPVPSAACQNRFGFPPPREDAQMMRLPSGVHTGLMSTAGLALKGGVFAGEDPRSRYRSFDPGCRAPPCAVRRDARHRIDARRRLDGLFPSLPVHPHQRSRLRTWSRNVTRNVDERALLREREVGLPECARHH
jgi:hypothetical protein